MRLTLCPSRLRELIKRANLRPPDENDGLRLIAQAFRAKRQGTVRHRRIKISSRSEITISLENGSVTATDELALALDQIEPVGKIELLRECPVCSQIFWAGRGDKEACTKHAAAWRKQQQRRRDKETKERRAKSRVKRKERQAEKPLILSSTTRAIIDAIEEHCRTWKSIDDHCYSALSKSYGRTGIYRTATVKRSLKMLVARGYLTYTEENNYYAPLEKLKRFIREREARRKKTMEESATH